MVRLTSDRPSGDFLKLPYSVDNNLHIYRVNPNTTNDIQVNLSITRCIDIIKPQGSSDVSIYLHSNSSILPAQDGYSLKQDDSGGIDTEEVSNAFVMTNVNGHFYLPMTSQSLLHDMVELARNMVGYVGIRVVPYREEHSLNLLSNDINKKLREIRKPIVKHITENVNGKSIRRRIEKEHPQKGGEFDCYGNEMLKKMREYPSLGIYSVYLFSGPTGKSFVTEQSYDSMVMALDRLKFIPIKPLKEKNGWFKRKETDPIDIISVPLFFDVVDVIKKCTKRYFSDSVIHRRFHSPIICVLSGLAFPFSNPSIAKTVPNKRAADRVNEDSMFGDSARSSSDVIDEGFFGSDGTS